jgi:hypothetical protein
VTALPRKLKRCDRPPARAAHRLRAAQPFGAARPWRESKYESSFLCSERWTEVEEIPLAVDLWGRRPGDGLRVIFECKTLVEGDRTGELHQCRNGLAQLLEYRLLYGSPEDVLCLVVDGDISLSDRRGDTSHIGG